MSEGSENDEFHGDDVGTSWQSANDVRDISNAYIWLGRQFPGCRLVSQSLCRHMLGWFDVMDIMTEAGEERTVFFSPSRHHSAKRGTSKPDSA